ncbi:MAG: hypothetical protein ACJLS3_00520 [Erythrobacter sp.]
MTLSQLPGSRPLGAIRCPPSAPTKLLVRQGWLLFVGIGGLLGTLALPGKIHDQIPWPRFNEERAWAGLPDDFCPALAAFIKEYPAGRYASKAKTIFENRLRGEARWVERVRTAPFFVGAGDTTPQASEAAAKAAAQGMVAAEVQKVCTGFAEAAGSRVKSTAPEKAGMAMSAIGVRYGVQPQAWLSALWKNWKRTAPNTAPCRAGKCVMKPVSGKPD